MLLQSYKCEKILLLNQMSIIPRIMLIHKKLSLCDTLGRLEVFGLFVSSKSSLQCLTYCLATMFLQKVNWVATTKKLYKGTGEIIGFFPIDQNLFAAFILLW